MWSIGARLKSLSGQKLERVFCFILPTTLPRGGSRPSAGGLNYITGVWGRSPKSQGQSPWSGGQRDEIPVKLTTFSYFRDYYLKKIITEIGKIKTKILFHFPGGRGPKSMAKLGGGMA